MRRLLLGTSALCAVAAAGPALAQSASQPVKLGLGGFWNGGYGDLVSQSGSNKANKRTDDIMVDAVINITGSTKFDNGLTAGVMVQLRGENLVPSTANSPTAANSTPDTIKKSYAFLGSDFGQIRIGDDDDARRQKAMGAPLAGSMFGANTPDLIWSNGPSLTNSTMKTIDAGKRVERLAYFSPTIAGFSFAASYAPGGEKGGAGEANEPNTTPTNGISTVNNSVSLAVGYSGKFSDVSLDAYAGGSSGHRVLSAPGVNTMTGRNNPSAIGGGAVVGFGPFKFGGAYERLYDVGTPVTNTNIPGVAAESSGHQTRNTWDIGPEFIAGPFSVSVDWTRGIYGNRNVNSSATNDVISLVGDYVLGPGVDVGAAIDWTHYHSNAGGPNAAQESVGGASYTGVALMTGIAFSF